MEEGTANVHPLTSWRVKNGLLHGDVGKQIKCSRQSIYRYEGGRMPNQPFLDRLIILTDGEVDGNSWLGKEAAEVVARRRARLLVDGKEAANADAQPKASA